MIDNDVRIYLNAVTLAHQAHAGQMYGDAPYTRHLAHVENVLSRHGFSDPTLLAAAWLLCLVAFGLIIPTP
jgi:(p)ppGpp synthase/HD superfamily hydrolase